MSKKALNIKKLAKSNPAVNPRQIAEAAKMLATLRAQGIGPARYDLAQPYTNRIRATGLPFLPIKSRKLFNGHEIDAFAFRFEN